MTDTTPTPADRPADQLRAAAEKLRAARFSGAITATPAVAALIGARLPLAVLLDAEALRYDRAASVGEFDASHERPLAVARQLLGTTAGEGVTPSADRRDRYAAAMALRDGHPEWPVRYEDDERDYRRRADAAMAVADAEQASLRADLPDRLQAVLTERYTVLGNPGSAMRIQEKGPDGWPAEFPVGPNRVAEVLRELLAVEQPPAPRIRCAHNDVVYGQCVRYLDNHDGDCQHERQPAAPAAPEEPTR
ncbi:hypothetical protein [Streptomyces globisporus]